MRSTRLEQEGQMLFAPFVSEGQDCLGDLVWRLATCTTGRRQLNGQVLGVLSRKAQFLQRTACPFFVIFLYLKLICCNSLLALRQQIRLGDLGKRSNCMVKQSSHDLCPSRSKISGQSHCIPTSRQVEFVGGDCHYLHD